MKTSHRRVAVFRSALALLALFGTAAPTYAEEETVPMRNPIGQVARLFNSNLVQVEDRVDWLQSRLGILAPHRLFPLKNGLGCRLARLTPGAPDPAVVLDLGNDFRIDRVFLVPAQMETGDAPELFPSCFTIDASADENFTNPLPVYSTTQRPFPAPNGYPLRFSAGGIHARYVRVTIQKGHQMGVDDLCTLSEIVVVSNGKPVSLGAPVRATGAMVVPGIWQPDYLTDGRMPLGIWQNGEVSPSRGLLVDCPDATRPVTMGMDLGETKTLDQLILFPYQLTVLADSGILPPEFYIRVADGPDGEVSKVICHHVATQRDANNPTPLVIPLGGIRARRIAIECVSSWGYSGKHMIALSEIEIWSGGHNIAAGKPVSVTANTGAETTTCLTDGFASERRILPLDSWLCQLYERWRLEREAASLLPERTQMAEESELNATWGSAVALGLTFLIPVVIVERRRLISSNHIDQLRKRIASDLHDDIGSNLGSISLIARTARKDLERMHGPEQVADDLGEVESIARESSLAMRDIVWLLERRQDTIGDLVQRMRDTGSRLLREMDYSITCNSSKSTAKLTLDAKRHLFLFYKEAVHNVVKHAKAKTVRVSLYDSRDSLVLEVKDDGVGIPSNIKNPATVLQKISDRARVLQGKLTVESLANQGTTLRLFIKRSHVLQHPSLP